MAVKSAMSAMAGLSPVTTAANPFFSTFSDTTRNFPCHIYTLTFCFLSPRKGTSFIGGKRMDRIRLFHWKACHKPDSRLASSSSTTFAQRRRDAKAGTGLASPSSEEAAVGLSATVDECRDQRSGRQA
jgi:hypothetical protein